MLDLLKKQKVRLIFSVIVFVFGLLGIYFEIIRAVQSEDFVGSMFVTLLYFTTQSNLLVTLTSLLFILKKEIANFYKYLSFITLVNITITAIIFHTLLVPYMSEIDFIQHLLHTINPILYILFYLIILTEKIELKKFWICLIYPLIFMVFVYTIVEPIFGNYLETIVSDFSSARYVYPFLDPRNYERETLGLIGFNLGILAPLIILLSYLLLLLKHKIYQLLYT